MFVGEMFNLDIFINSKINVCQWSYSIPFVLSCGELWVMSSKATAASDDVALQKTEVLFHQILRGEVAFNGDDASSKSVSCTETAQLKQTSVASAADSSGERSAASSSTESTPPTASASMKGFKPESKREKQKREKGFKRKRGGSPGTQAYYRYWSRRR